MRPLMADSIQITLPDGSTEGRPGRHPRRRLRQGVHRPGPGEGRGLRPLQRQGGRPHPPADRGRASWRSSPPRAPRPWSSSATTPRTWSPAPCSGSSPGTQVTIGPTIEDGFYYDFFRDKPFTPEDLEKIEAEANEEIAQNLPFVREEVSIDEAIKLFEAKGEKFKVEIIEDIVAKGAKTLTLYRHGDWVDFCLGPHGPSTGKIGVIKLLSLQRRVLARRSPQPDAPAHLRHRLLRQEGARRVAEAAGGGEEARPPQARQGARPLPLPPVRARARPSGRPKGTALYQMLAELDAPARPARTATSRSRPRCSSTRALWEMSGHWGKYKENMFLVLDSETGEHDFSLKPMNCPSHHLYFGFKKHSYRDLPLRLHTQDVLHRNEASGSLGGLTRVRQFAQDDAHIYCTESQIADEVQRFVELLDQRLQRGRPQVRRPSSPPARAQRLGDDALWDRAEAALEARAEVAGHRVRAQARRRRVLRPEDRLRRLRQHRPQVAAGHHPARLQRPGALRPHLRRRGQRRAPAGRPPPRHLRLASSASSPSSSSTSPARSRPGSRRCRSRSSRSPTASSTTPARCASGSAPGLPRRAGRARA